MPPADLLATFFAAALLLALAPGPDNLFVLTQSATGGKGAGLAVTLGLCTGLVGHTLAVVLGVAALVQASALAFNGLKLLGAGYLLYLAWQAVRAPTARLAAPAAAPPAYTRLYRRGIFMNLTNPKVSLFFLAFLPQFADPGRGPLAPQLLLLGGLFIVATLLVFGAIALLAGTLGERLNRSPGLQRLLFRAPAALLQAGAQTNPDYPRLYRRGILMNLSNPKVSLFFLAFLPQFADPGRGSVAPQLLALGGTFIVATLLVFGTIAVLAGALGERLNRSAGLQRLLNRLAGAVFFGLALQLARSRS